MALPRPKRQRDPNKPKKYKPAKAFSSQRPVQQKAVPGQKEQPAPEAPVDPYAWQDPNYQLADAGAWRNQQNSDLNLVYKRDQALRDAGYQIDANTGNLSQMDLSQNPYSRASLMKKAYDQSLRRNVNAAAGQGQLYAGSLDRAQVGATSNYSQQQNALLTSLYDLMANTEAGIAANQAAYQDALANAGLTGLGDAQKADLTPQGEATPGTKGQKAKYGRSPRSYQQQINRIRKNQPKSKARSQKIQTLVKKRNQSIKAIQKGTK